VNGREEDKEDKLERRNEMKRREEADMQDMKEKGR
jgi:hypothetical protein